MTVPSQLPPPKRAQPDPVAGLEALLVFLQQHPTRLTARGQPPVASLRALAKRLPARFPPPPGALDLIYGRLLCRLALSLGLALPVGGRLKPGPGAQAWLAMPRAEQWREIWAQLAEPPAPASRGPTAASASGTGQPTAMAARDATGLRALAAALSQAAGPAGSSWRMDGPVLDSACAALARDLPWWQADGGDLKAELLRLSREILLPLGWLRSAGRSGTLALAPGAVWAMGLGGSRPPRQPTAQIRLEADFSLYIGRQARSGSSLALAAWTEWDAKAGRQRFTEQSVARGAVVLGAMRQDASDALLHLLQRALGSPPTEEQMRHLGRWCSARPALRISRRLLLELSAPQDAPRLRADRALVAALGRQWGDLALELDPKTKDQLHKVIGRLEALGYSVDAAHLEPLSSYGQGVDDRGAAAWRLVALRLLEALSPRYPGLPMPPAEAFAGLESAATLPVDGWLDAWLAILEPAGRSNVLSPVVNQAILDGLEDALESGSDIELCYPSAQGGPAWRSVTPKAILWRRGRLSLNAFCHLRQADRSFRLDRVTALRPTIPGDDGWAAGPSPYGEEGAEPST